MTPKELKERLSKGEQITLLDVREADEYESSDKKIEGAQNVPMGKVFVEAQKGELPKDKKIITICKTGGRCGIVAKELKEKGFDIEYLEGGVEAWEEEK